MTHVVIQGLPPWLNSKKSICNAEDTGSIPGLGRSPGEGNGYLLQYSCLENSMDRRVYSPWGHKELVTAEWLSLCYHILEEQLERSSPGLQNIYGVIRNKM